MEKEVEYREVFRRSGLDSQAAVQYKYDAICEEHSSEYGWEVAPLSECNVTFDSQTHTYTLEVPLTKYKVNGMNFRR